MRTKNDLEYVKNVDGDVTPVHAEAPPIAPVKEEPHFITEGDLVKYLKKNLAINVETGHFTDPNTYNFQLVLNGKVISQHEVYITQRPEYEG